MEKNKVGRPLGAVNVTERNTRKALREIVTPEQYAAIIQRLVDIAMNGKKDLDAINAAKIIIDRLEGKLPETVINNITNTLTVDDLIKRDNE